MPPDDQDEIYEDLPPPEGNDDVLRELRELLGRGAPKGEPDLPVPRPSSSPVPTGPGASSGQPPAPIDESVPPGGGEGYVAKRRLNPHEVNQRVITFAVIGMLALVVLTICLTWVIYPGADLNNISTILLVPLIAFAGPIMGFYFGKRKGGS